VSVVEWFVCSAMVRGDVGLNPAGYIYCDIWFFLLRPPTLEYRIRVPARLLVECQDFQQALLLNTKNDKKKLGTIIRLLRIFLKALLFRAALLFGTREYLPSSNGTL